MKLRNWVKYLLLILIMAGIMIIANNHYNNAIRKCVNSGHSYNYCINGLK